MDNNIRKWIVLLWLCMLQTTTTNAQSNSVWDNFSYPTVTVIDLGAGTNNSATAILNAIGSTEEERIQFYNARILSVVKRLYKTPQEVPNFTDLELVFDPNYCGGIAAKSGNPPRIRIQNSTHYLTMVLNQSSDELLAEIGGTLTHEVTHAYSHVPQNAGDYAEGNDFFGFIEGIADFVRLKEGYSTLADIQIDQNSKWLKGYNGSAFFINYLDENYTDFAYQFNQSCQTINPWSFKKATEQIIPGKTIDQLWTEYVNSIQSKQIAVAAPVANFEVPSVIVNAGEEVLLTNTSENSLESAWFYEGKSCVGFTNSKDFKIVFDKAGEYTVTLEAKNFRGKNYKSVTFVVKPCGNKGNIASGKPVYVSSTERDEFKAEYAVDGDLSTRWSSNFTENEWLTIDLEKESGVCAVEITWFSCCNLIVGAKGFEVQHSQDNLNWVTAATVVNNFDNYSYVPVTVNARYIRIKGTKRTIESLGYSISELKVYGTDETLSTERVKLNQEKDFALYPIPANNQVSIVFSKTKKAKVNIYNLLGENVYSQNHEFINNQESLLNIHLPNGVYLLEVEGVLKKLLVENGAK